MDIAWPKPTIPVLASLPASVGYAVGDEVSLRELAESIRAILVRVLSQIRPLSCKAFSQNKLHRILYRLVSSLQGLLDCV
jgi:hypothetical protein